MNEQQNRPTVRPASILVPQATCPIPLGSVGFWVDKSDGILKQRAADGTDALMGGGLSTTSVATLVASVVSASPLPTNTYDNGTLGVGAFLQKSTNGALPSIDGVAPTVGMVILVAGEATAANNGLYTVTSLGGATKWKLTRMDDFDQSVEMVKGTTIEVTQGSLYSGTEWQYTGINSPIVGTTALTFVQDRAGTTPTYSNTTRPAANAVGASPTSPVQIWNTDDTAPNWSDGTNWYDATGNIT